MYRHRLGATRSWLVEGVLMSFQHRQDGTAGALVAGDVDRDISIDRPAHSAGIPNGSVEALLTARQQRGGQRLRYRDDAAREARRYELAYCPNWPRHRAA